MKLIPLVIFILPSYYYYHMWVWISFYKKTLSSNHNVIIIDIIMKLDDFSSSALPFDCHNQKEASYIYFLLSGRKGQTKNCTFSHCTFFFCTTVPNSFLVMWWMFDLMIGQSFIRQVTEYIGGLHKIYTYTIYIVKNTLIIRHFKTCMGDFYQISQHDIYLLLLKSMSVGFFLANKCFS